MTIEDNSLVYSGTELTTSKPAPDYDFDKF